MADLKWETPASFQSLMSTGLNSLANNALELDSTEIDNSSSLNTFMDLELKLASLDLSGSANPSVVIYMIESIDGGTDFDTASDAETADNNMPASDKIIAVIGLRPYSGSEAKIAIKSMIPIPPGSWYLALRNKTGAAFASSGNTLGYRLYNMQSV